MIAVTNARRQQVQRLLGGVALVLRVDRLRERRHLREDGRQDGDPSRDVLVRVALFGPAPRVRSPEKVGGQRRVALLVRVDEIDQTGVRSDRFSALLALIEETFDPGRFEIPVDHQHPELLQA